MVGTSKIGVLPSPVETLAADRSRHLLLVSCFILRCEKILNHAVPRRFLTPCHLILFLITVMAQELYMKHRGFSKGHFQSNRLHLALRNLLLSLALVSLARREGLGGLVYVRVVAELPTPLRRGAI